MIKEFLWEYCFRNKCVFSAFYLLSLHATFPEASTSARHRTSVKERSPWTDSTELGIMLSTTGTLLFIHVSIKRLNTQSLNLYPFCFDIAIQGTSGSSPMASSWCSPPLRILCQSFPACVRETSGTALRSTSSEIPSAVVTTAIVFPLTEWILFCSVISVCHKRRTTKPKSLLSSARKRRM